MTTDPALGALTIVYMEYSTPPAVLKDVIRSPRLPRTTSIQRSAKEFKFKAFGHYESRSP